MKKIVLATLIATALSGCAADDPNKRTKTGAAVGAAAGALLGYAVDDGTGGVVAGAAVGALAGAGVGRYMDNQQREFEQALADEQARNELKIQQLENETLKIDIASEVSFDFDSASLKSAFTPTLNKVADVLQRYPKTVIHVVGHTDSVGSESYNQQLSERRAQSVADYLASNGVERGRLYATGRGELEPRATNETEAGRQLNRRVELFVKPIVEGQESEAYQAP
ncbi:OmpA family protein [Methylophaga sp. OBS1]|jgi:outer membrane protein OmpA-like peptidoglycan-associated protein|uniref:OmpA family protein n=1 Tax=Methylophaga sp. OBS1 TaxID=2991933 RepID=UPI0022573E82|nr:OmpA family protein [Methylophaga sp. OBS1]MCX4193478.1 OmpA family protein [Methylophaga sp. OBS1]